MDIIVDANSLLLIILMRDYKTTKTQPSCSDISKGINWCIKSNRFIFKSGEFKSIV